MRPVPPRRASPKLPDSPTENWFAISEPRHPCLKFTAAMGFKHAARPMQQSGFCGCYLTVIGIGQVQAGDRITLRPGPRDVNIRDLFKARVGRGGG